MAYRYPSQSQSERAQPEVEGYINLYISRKNGSRMKLGKGIALSLANTFEKQLIELLGGADGSEKLKAAIQLEYRSAKPVAGSELDI